VLRTHPRAGTGRTVENPQNSVEPALLALEHPGQPGVAGFEHRLDARELLTLLKKSPAGRIVNLSSILGSLTLHADPKSPIYDFKAFAYNSSKSALNAFTIHLAYELKDTPIKVNSAHPGWVKTEMGGDAAPLEIPDGAKTSVELALIGPDGPSGRFIHMGNELPW